MLSAVLAAYLAIALPERERPARPTDEQMLAEVQAKAPNARILSSAFGPSRSIGAWTGCGLVEIGGTVEPFAVYTHWQEARRTLRFPPVSVRGEDGRMRRVHLPPSPARPARWETKVSVPLHMDFDNDGVDRNDRGIDIAMRRLALQVCDALTPPEGVTWVTEREPHPDPEREAEINRQVEQLTDLLMGAAARRAEH